MLDRAQLGDGVWVRSGPGTPVPSRLRTSSSQARPLRRGLGPRQGASSPGRRASALASRARSPPRSGLRGPVGTNAPHPTHPEGNCNSSFFFFSAALFSDVFFAFFWLFLFVCLFVGGEYFLGGRAERGPEKQTQKPTGGGERGGGGCAGARSAGLRACVRPPRPPPRRAGRRARVAPQGGQLLYWHALRPEAGPCRPP